MRFVSFIWNRRSVGFPLLNIEKFWGVSILVGSDCIVFKYWLIPVAYWQTTIQQAKVAFSDINNCWPKKFSPPKYLYFDFFLNHFKVFASILEVSSIYSEMLSKWYFYQSVQGQLNIIEAETDTKLTIKYNWLS